MIELRDVTKRFGDFTAVSDLSLHVEKGEIYGIIGPNGAGKTTTIRMMVGLYAPTQGQVVVDGLDIQRNAQDVKRVIGYIPDDPFFYDRLTGREVLHLVGELFQLPLAVRTKKINSLLDMFPMRNIIDSYVEFYSRGNRQKLSFLAALLHEPKILIVDEPMVGIDPDGARIVEDLFKDFAKKGGTVFISTHTLSIAQRVCSRVGVISEGSLVKEGSIQALKERFGDDEFSLEDFYFANT